MLDDVLDDVGRRVVNAAGLLDLGFLLDLRVVALGEPDDLAEKLFVDAAEDVGAEHRELVGAVGIVKILENFLERLVVYIEPERQTVRLFGAVILFPKVKQPRVVALVGLAEVFGEAFVDVGAILQRLKLPVRLDAAVLADAQEDDAVYGLLDGVVERVLGKLRVAQRDVLRERFAPRFDFIEKHRVHRRRALLALWRSRRTCRTSP